MFNATQEQLTDKEEAQMTDMLADEFPSTRAIFSFHVSFLLSTVFLHNVVFQFFQFPLGMPTIQFFFMPFHAKKNLAISANNKMIFCSKTPVT